MGGPHAPEMSVASLRWRLSLRMSLHGAFKCVASSLLFGAWCAAVPVHRRWEACSSSLKIFLECACVRHDNGGAQSHRRHPDSTEGFRSRFTSNPPRHGRCTSRPPPPNASRIYSLAFCRTQCSIREYRWSIFYRFVSSAPSIIDVAAHEMFLFFGQQRCRGIKGVGLSEWVGPGTFAG